MAKKFQGRWVNYASIYSVYIVQATGVLDRNNPVWQGKFLSSTEENGCIYYMSQAKESRISRDPRKAYELYITLKFFISIYSESQM